MEGKKGELYIPVHTPDADDFVAGIGKFEGLVVGISGVVSLLLAIISYAVMENVIVAVMFSAIIIALTITIIRRDSHNENLVNKLMIVWDFYKSQKRYYYRYHSIYESGEYENEEE